MAENQIKDYIMNIIIKEKPKSVKETVDLIQQHRTFAEETIINVLLELENERMLSFIVQSQFEPQSAKSYIFSLKAVWYWITIFLAFAFATVITVASGSPYLYARVVLSAAFLLFLPGYAILKILFASELKIKLAEKSLDSTERIILCVGLSLAVTLMVGLILNYLPWGINLVPVTVSLITLTVAVSTIALITDFYSGKGIFEYC